MLFGRPWQYDCNTMHNGQDNTYTFYENKKKCILAPMRKPTSMVCMKDNTTKVSKDNNWKNNANLLLLLKENIMSQGTLDLVQPLLIEFNHVICEDLPAELLPLGD